MMSSTENSEIRKLAKQQAEKEPLKALLQVEIENFANKKNKDRDSSKNIVLSEVKVLLTEARRLFDVDSAYEENAKKVLNILIKSEEGFFGFFANPQVLTKIIPNLATLLTLIEVLNAEMLKSFYKELARLGPQGYKQLNEAQLSDLLASPYCIGDISDFIFSILDEDSKRNYGYLAGVKALVNTAFSNEPNLRGQALEEYKSLKTSVAKKLFLKTYIDFSSKGLGQSSAKFIELCLLSWPSEKTSFVPFVMKHIETPGIAWSMEIRAAVLSKFSTEESDKFNTALNAYASAQAASSLAAKDSQDGSSDVDVTIAARRLNLDAPVTAFTTPASFGTPLAAPKTPATLNALAAQLLSLDESTRLDTKKTYDDLTGEEQRAVDAAYTLAAGDLAVGAFSPDESVRAQHAALYEALILPKAKEQYEAAYLKEIAGLASSTFDANAETRAQSMAIGNSLAFSGAAQAYKTACIESATQLANAAFDASADTRAQSIEIGQSLEARTDTAIYAAYKAAYINNAKLLANSIFDVETTAVDRAQKIEMGNAITVPEAQEIFKATCLKAVTALANSALDTDADAAIRMSFTEIGGTISQLPDASAKYNELYIKGAKKLVTLALDPETEDEVRAQSITIGTSLALPEATQAFNDAYCKAATKLASSALDKDDAVRARINIIAREFADSIPAANEQYKAAYIKEAIKLVTSALVQDEAEQSDCLKLYRAFVFLEAQEAFVIKYLEHVLVKEGVKPSPVFIQLCVTNWPLRDSSSNELLSFALKHLGAITWDVPTIEAVFKNLTDLERKELSQSIDSKACELTKEEGSDEVMMSIAIEGVAEDGRLLYRVINPGSAASDILPEELSRRIRNMAWTGVMTLNDETFSSCWESTGGATYQASKVSFEALAAGLKEIQSVGTREDMIEAYFRANPYYDTGEGLANTINQITFSDFMLLVEALEFNSQGSASSDVSLAPTEKLAHIVTLLKSTKIKIITQEELCRFVSTFDAESEVVSPFAALTLYHLMSQATIDEAAVIASSGEDIQKVKGQIKYYSLAKEKCNKFAEDAKKHLDAPNEKMGSYIARLVVNRPLADEHNNYSHLQLLSKFYKLFHTRKEKRKFKMGGTVKSSAAVTLNTMLTEDGPPLMPAEVIINGLRDLMRTATVDPGPEAMALIHARAMSLINKAYIQVVVPDDTKTSLFTGLRTDASEKMGNKGFAVMFYYALTMLNNNLEMRTHLLANIPAIEIFRVGSNSA